MDTNLSPVCVANPTQSIPNTMVPVQDVQNKQKSTQEQLYYISIEQPDKTSQLVQVTEEQANALGIYFYNLSENAEPAPTSCAKTSDLAVNTSTTEIDQSCKPLGSSENPIEIIKDGEVIHSTQNISVEYLQQIADALHTTNKEEANTKECVDEQVVYRVMYPDELRLRPTQTKRGRPKKGLSLEKPVEQKPEEKSEMSKIVKNVRTRSGRITRPPGHIKKVFSKIEPTGTEMSDIKPMEFEPLKTSLLNESENIKNSTFEILVKEKRKRPIAAQYRCPKCGKAYLGHNRMLKHIEEHPDHGPIPEYTKKEENDTWNYLIEITNNLPPGKRGMKFINELITLLRNVQIVAKVLFKRPSVTDRNLYFLDSFLSRILGVASGDYVINERHLQKDINALQFISENTSTKDVESDKPNTFDLHAYVEKVPLDSQEEKRFKHTEGVPNHKFVGEPATQLNFDIQSTNDFPQTDLTFEENITSNFEEENDPKHLVRPSNKQEDLRNNFSIQNDLLSDNSLLNSLPTLRTSVEELILSNVDNTQVSNLLDNSTSSDEVMNVDQFVNERFKKFTEQELELPNPLTLDLPSLDLFNFHSS